MNTKDTTDTKKKRAADASCNDYNNQFSLENRLDKTILCPKNIIIFILECCKDLC